MLKQVLTVKLLATFKPTSGLDVPKNVRTSVKEDEHSGCPSAGITIAGIAKVYETIFRELKGSCENDPNYFISHYWI